MTKAGRREPFGHRTIFLALPKYRAIRFSKIFRSCSSRAGNGFCPKPRLTIATAQKRFLARFPQGFRDPDYLAQERNYKWKAHEIFAERLGRGQLQDLLDKDDTPEIVRRIKSVISRLNLLSKFEQMALSDALDDNVAARRYAASLNTLLSAAKMERALYEQYLEAVAALPQPKGKARVVTWPVATLLPALAQPDRHIFLKPEVTKHAADSLAFHLHYDSAPNWVTYHALLRMADIYSKLLADLEPRDYVDIQSFIWVACGGYD